MESSIDYKELGERIKQQRRSRNLSQEKLAELVECNAVHISNIENAHTKVSLSTLFNIANALGTTVDSFLMNQYDNADDAYNSVVLEKLKRYDNEKKERILKMMDLL